ncbi:MAG TPA: ester cyclase [Kouleothrix sp.]|uniref:ester cyclase n=1 Tax=Kouleothrix sp. TaxID=2779161 RepID=UPI002C7DB8E5|nr:ester cyclase [Kouleothrix sp.]HRC77350.1 ester cyclase [Kouleothrix sp.]
MSIADLKARTQLIFDMFNTHDAAAAAAYFADNAELRDVAVSRPAVGRSQIAGLYARHFAAFPDSHVRVERIVAEGSTVAVEWSLSGTHMGPFMGIPATGKPINFNGISLIRYHNGAAVADTRVWDVAGLLRQIGLLPGQE